ncbi:MAG: DNA methyltransferase [Myxococcota bacterium]
MISPKEIVQLRQRRGWSQQQLAETLDVTFATVSRWEQGKSSPRADRARVLRRLLDDAPRDNVLSIDQIADQVWAGDCRTLLNRLPNDAAHCVISDIPYGIGADDWDVLHDNQNSAYLGNSPAQKRAGDVFKRRGKPINGWSAKDREIPQQYYRWCLTWLPACLRILKPGGALILFAGRRMAPRAAVAVEDAGFNLRDMLAWIRPNAVHRAQRASGVFERRGNPEAAAAWAGWRLGNLQPRFEPILWAGKPYRVTLADNLLEHGVGAFNQSALDATSKDSPANVFQFGRTAAEGNLHVAQKPLALMKALIALVTVQGQLVVDPFAGSGTTGLAAKQLDRRFLLIERDPQIAAVARERLEMNK